MSEELKETTEEEAETVTEETADDRDDEFEYDENGNIIIPDVEYPQDELDEMIDESGEEIEEESSEEETAESEESEEEETHEDDAAESADEKDREIERLKKQLADLEAQGADTLKRLGIDEKDIKRGLAKVAAEAADKPVDEYIKEQDEQRQTEDAKRELARIRFEEKMRADLAEVHEAFPDSRQYKSISDIPNFARFGQLRDVGLTPKEAYIAANPDAVQKSVASAVKQQNLNETKSHLKSNVPKGANNGAGFSMTKAELAQARDLFPDKSTKEIMALYKQIR